MGEALHGFVRFGHRLPGKADRTPRRISASCRCGWESGWRANEAQAVDAFAQHVVEEMARVINGRDLLAREARTTSGLLRCAQCGQPIKTGQYFEHTGPTRDTMIHTHCWLAYQDAVRIRNTGTE